jgi:AcrR family transcriptional regulator
MNETKEHILDVSLTLFLQKSYKAVTMKEIVEKTGLSKGAFYYYFESKEQLFTEVFEHYYGDLVREDLSQYSRESLRAFYYDCLNDSQKKFSKFLKIGQVKNKSQTLNHHLLLFEAIARIPSFQEMHDKESEKELAEWEGMIKKARKNGEISTSLTNERVAKMFLYMGEGHGVRAFIKGNQHIEEIFRETQELWDGLYSLLKA